MMGTLDVSFLTPRHPSCSATISGLFPARPAAGGWTNSFDCAASRRPSAWRGTLQIHVIARLLRMRLSLQFCSLAFAAALLCSSGVRVVHAQDATAARAAAPDTRQAAALVERAGVALRENQFDDARKLYEQRAETRPRQPGRARRDGAHAALRGAQGRRQHQRPAPPATAALPGHASATACSRPPQAARAAQRPRRRTCPSTPPNW